MHFIQKNFKQIGTICVLTLGLVALGRCASNPSQERTVSTATEAAGPPESPTAESIVNARLALEFDRLLKGELPQSDSRKLQASCEEAPLSNPFCYSVLNRDSLASKAKEVRRGKPRAPRSKKRISAKFKGGNLTNWDDLRTAPVNSLLRGFSIASPMELRKIELIANEEIKCPNNAAIALAAVLEDDLPDRIEPKDIARLYKKGAECSEHPPADREVVLTRAGLFHFLIQDYETAGNLFQRSAALEETFTGRALYWLHRTRAAQGQKAAAQAAFQQLHARYPFSFHTLVAATTQKHDPGVVLSRSMPNPRKRSGTVSSANLLVEQVEILIQNNFPESASTVLDWAIAESREAEPELRIYLAELKTDEGDHLSKLMLLSDILYKHPALVAKETMELYFPKVMFPIFERNAGELDPLFLLSVARQESAFNIKAKSTANARGLLQVTPPTGKRFNNNTAPNLFNPELNVQIGARYLKSLLGRWNGQVPLALAAYNAGENRVSTWLSRYPTSEPILFVDLIPYRETREYIASILRNYFWYRRIHSEQSGLEGKLFDVEIVRRDDADPPPRFFLKLTQ